MSEEKITITAQAIMTEALKAGACSTTAGRGMGLTALARDARQAAEVLLGLKTVEGGFEFREDGAPKIGRPRKVTVLETSSPATKNSLF